MSIPLPRLLNGSGGTERELHPLSVSLNLEITPLSSASIRLPKDENLPARGYVEVFSPMGSVGIFRVRSPEDAYGQDITTAELEHAITEVGDYLVRENKNEMKAANSAMQEVFGYYTSGGGTRWQLGSVSALGSGSIALEVNYDRVLDAMLAILEQKPDCMMAFDFSTSPWTVSIVAKATTVGAEGRLSRNVNSARVVYDDTDLCTRAYYETFAENSHGEMEGTWRTMDADTISTYGIVEREVDTDSSYTLSEAQAVVTEYLRQHKNPKVSISIQAEELSHITGEAWDTFTIGKLCRLALPDYGVTVEENISSLAWGDVYNAPENVSVQLGAPQDTVITFLHDVDASGGTKSGGKGAKIVSDKNKEYWTRFEQTDKRVDIAAMHADKAGNILEQAGMDLNAQGVLIYADDNANMVGSRFNVQANMIGMVVGTNEQGNFVKAAEITAEINKSGSTARINANRVKIGESGSTTITLNDLITVGSGGIMVIRGAMSAQDISIAAQKGITFNPTTGGTAYELTLAKLLGLVKDVKVEAVGNNYKLYKKSYAGSDDASQDWVEAGTFSRATTASVSGTWSSGVFTVSASSGSISPSQVTTSLTQGTASWSGKQVTIPVYATINNGATPVATGKSVTATYSGVVISDINECYTTAPNGASYDGNTNTSGGYFISGNGRGASCGIVVKCELKQGNTVQKTLYNDLITAPNNLYKKGWDNAADKIGMPSTISGSTTKSSVSVTIPTTSGTTTWTLKLSKDSGGAYLTINGNLKLRVS